MGEVLSVVYAWVAALCTVTKTPLCFNKNDVSTSCRAPHETLLISLGRVLCVWYCSPQFPKSISELSKYGLLASGNPGRVAICALIDGKVFSMLFHHVELVTILGIPLT